MKVRRALYAFLALAVLVSVGGIGYGLGQEWVVVAAEDDNSPYKEGLNAGYESGYNSGYTEGYIAYALELLESKGVTFTDDSRWYSMESTTLSIEESIDRSIHAANNHAYHAYVLNSSVEHNIYWMNVHNSCAYWLEQLD